MTDRVSSEEMIESLTGFEEIAIAGQFDAEVLALAEAKPTMFLRALVFVLLMHEGKSAPDARQAVYGMTLAAVQEHFDDGDDREVMVDDTEAGKDEPQPVAAPKS